MPREKSAGFVIFRKCNDKIEYLILHYEVDYWGFSKGRIEEGENFEQTAVRELEEETGIKNIKIIPGFKKEIEYFFKRNGKTIFKSNIYFLAETADEGIKLSWEHLDYKWLPYEQALEQLTYENSKQVLKTAHKFINK